MGVAEDAFERLRRVAFDGEHVERMAALGARLQLSPGVIKTLMRLATQDGVSMGEMARGIGVDPSYITALVDDLDERGLARREPAPDDRRVKIIVLTDAGRALARDRRGPLGAALGLLAPVALEFRQLRDLSTKWWRRRIADRDPGREAPTTVTRSRFLTSLARRHTSIRQPRWRREGIPGGAPLYSIRRGSRRRP